MIFNIASRSTGEIANQDVLTFLNGVNASGVIVGATSGGLGGNTNAILIRNGNTTYLQPKGVNGKTTSSYAYGINDLGHIVGSFTDDAGRHGFIFKDGAYTVLDAPGAVDTIAFGINNHDVVTVQADRDLFPNSYVYENGTYTPLNVPGAMFSVIRGINDAGEIVFTYDVAPDIYGEKAALYSNGRFTDITYPNSRSTEPYGINNAGMISGSTVMGPYYYGFIASPIR